jgi:hypothetical protein
MQKARLIVTGTSESCRRNFEITCYCDHFALCFWSGSRENKLVVQKCENDVHVRVTKEAWRSWLKDVFKRFWEDLKNVIILNLEERFPLKKAAYEMIGNY